MVHHLITQPSIDFESRQLMAFDNDTRRAFLRQSGHGFAGLALGSLLHPLNTASGLVPTVKRKHQGTKAKSIIWLFMNGGPSSIDLFDHKPLLNKLHGQPFPGKIKTLFPYPGPIMGSPFPFKQHGQSGATVSGVLPNLARHADKLTFLRACVSDEQNHVPACYVMNTGSRQMGAPALGSWASYGLGREDSDIPHFVVMTDHRSSPEGGASLWGPGFLPSRNQGVVFRAAPDPILYLESPYGVSHAEQNRKLQFLTSINQNHAALHGRPQELETRTAAFETAFRMQSRVPKIVDLSDESSATFELYGLERPETQHFGRQCLLARRLVEQKVPFIQIYHGGYENNWDQHGGLEDGHRNNCLEIDQPIAGLLEDLEQRGLLESTLVVWGGEFGRGPTAQDRDGRDHNPYGFTMWMAGAGVKPGFSYGATDEFGYLPVEGAVTAHDLHATILHLMGIDETELQILSGGREQTPTNGLGSVVTQILS